VNTGVGVEAVDAWVPLQLGGRCNVTLHPQARREAHESSNPADGVPAGDYRVRPTCSRLSGKLRKFRVRIKTKSVVSTTIEARDQYEAVVKNKPVLT